MSPRSTLMRFGSSSMLVRRSNLPSGCRRGSLRILKIGPSASLRCMSSSRSSCAFFNHRAQLEHLEAATVLPDTLLRVERRTAGYRDDPDSRNGHDRYGQQQQETTEHEIDRAF